MPVLKLDPQPPANTVLEDLCDQIIYEILAFERALNEPWNDCALCYDEPDDHVHGDHPAITWVDISDPPPPEDSSDLPPEDSSDLPAPEDSSDLSAAEDSSDLSAAEDSSDLSAPEDSSDLPPSEELTSGLLETLVLPEKRSDIAINKQSSKKNPDMSDGESSVDTIVLRKRKPKTTTYFVPRDPARLPRPVLSTTAPNTSDKVQTWLTSANNETTETDPFFKLPTATRWKKKITSKDLPFGQESAVNLAIDDSTDNPFEFISSQPTPEKIIEKTKCTSKAKIRPTVRSSKYKIATDSMALKGNNDKNKLGRPSKTKSNTALQIANDTEPELLFQYSVKRPVIKNGSKEFAAPSRKPERPRSNPLKPDTVTKQQMGKRVEGACVKEVDDAHNAIDSTNLTVEEDSQNNSAGLEVKRGRKCKSTTDVSAAQPTGALANGGSPGWTRITKLGQSFKSKKRTLGSLNVSGGEHPPKRSSLEKVAVEHSETDVQALQDDEMVGVVPLNVSNVSADGVFPGFHEDLDSPSSVFNEQLSDANKHMHAAYHAEIEKVLTDNTVTLNIPNKLSESGTKNLPVLINLASSPSNDSNGFVRVGSRKKTKGPQKHLQRLTGCPPGCVCKCHSISWDLNSQDSRDLTREPPIKESQPTKTSHLSVTGKLRGVHNKDVVTLPKMLPEVLGSAEDLYFTVPRPNEKPWPQIKTKIFSSDRLANKDPKQVNWTRVYCFIGVDLSSDEPGEPNLENVIIRLTPTEMTDVISNCQKGSFSNAVEVLVRADCSPYNVLNRPEIDCSQLFKDIALSRDTPQLGNPSSQLPAETVTSLADCEASKCSDAALPNNSQLPDNIVEHTRRENHGGACEIITFVPQLPQTVDQGCDSKDEKDAQTIDYTSRDVPIQPTQRNPDKVSKKKRQLFLESSLKNTEYVPSLSDPRLDISPPKPTKSKPRRFKRILRSGDSTSSEEECNSVTKKLKPDMSEDIVENDDEAARKPRHMSGSDFDDARAHDHTQTQSAVKSSKNDQSSKRRKSTESGSCAPKPNVSEDALISCQKNLSQTRRKSLESATPLLALNKSTAKHFQTGSSSLGTNSKQTSLPAKLKPNVKAPHTLCIPKKSVPLSQFPQKLPTNKTVLPGSSFLSTESNNYGYVDIHSNSTVDYPNLIASGKSANTPDSIDDIPWESNAIANKCLADEECYNAHEMFGTQHAQGTQTAGTQMQREERSVLIQNMYGTQQPRSQCEERSTLIQNKYGTQQPRSQREERSVLIQNTYRAQQPRMQRDERSVLKPRLDQDECSMLVNYKSGTHRDDPEMQSETESDECLEPTPQKTRVVKIISKSPAPRVATVRQTCLATTYLTEKGKKDVRLFAELCGATLCEETFSKDVTHLITGLDEDGHAVSTYKFICAVASGIWVVSIDWVDECLRRGAIVSEEMYEVTDAENGVKGSRISRKRSKGILSDFIFYFVEPFEEHMDKVQLQNLVHYAGAEMALSCPPAGLHSNKKYFLALADSEMHRSGAPFDGWFANEGILTMCYSWLREAIVCQNLRLGSKQLITSEQLVLQNMSLLQERYPPAMWEIDKDTDSSDDPFI